MFTHDHVLSAQWLHCRCAFPLFLHPSRFGHPPVALLAPHRHPLTLLIILLFLSPSLFLATCPDLLNYRFTTVYVILFVCAVWFVVYLTLSLLLDVVDHGGNKTAFWILHPHCLDCFGRYLLGIQTVEMGDLSMIDDPALFKPLWSTRNLGSSCCLGFGVSALLI